MLCCEQWCYNSTCALHVVYTILELYFKRQPSRGHWPGGGGPDDGPGLRYDGEGDVGSSHRESHHQQYNGRLIGKLFVYSSCVYANWAALY